MGHRITVVHVAGTTSDLEFRDQMVPAVRVHAALMAALAFAYAAVMNTQEYLEG